MEFETLPEAPAKPMAHLMFGGGGGRRIRKQPPIRVRYCEVHSKAKDGDRCAIESTNCRGPLRTCRRCAFHYCATHEHHVKTVEAPPDGWRTLRRFMGREVDRVAPKGPRAKSVAVLAHPRREPLLKLVVAGVVLENARPIPVEFCRVPSSGNVARPCGNPSKKCRGESRPCVSCGFGYCAWHYPRHMLGFYWPRDDWETIVRRIRNAKSLVFYGQRKLLTIRAPRLVPQSREA